MVSRFLISGLLIFTSLQSFSQVTQIVVTPNKSHREGTNFSVPCDTPPLCDFHKMVTWNDSQILQYAYEGKNAGGQVIEFLNWRMVFPLNYDPNRVQKYPMIVMLHGAGESGRIWTGQYNYPTSDVRFDNNGHNILHGGQAHLNAVNRNPNLSNAFPGIVIWPQASYNGAWENGWNGGNMNETGAMVGKVVDWIIENINVDPDRIAVHGLSNGGKGTWEMATKRADLFAAALPMSGVGSNNTAMAQVLNTTPLWLFQGGTDTNPRPQAAVDAIAALELEGGDPRYTLYPTLGHGVWNTAYAEPDFFSWILSKSKKNIYVFGGDPSICPGGTLRLGFSDKFLAYQWTRDGIDIPGATTRFYNATVTGTYTVKYRRRITPKWETTDWAESNSIVVGNKAASTYVPLLTNTGSTVLPIKRGANNVGGVNNIITFTVEPGYSTYYWFKDGNAMSPATTTINTRSISSNNGAQADAGIYTVKVLEATGCISAASNPITVTWTDPQPANPTPSTPTMTALTSTSLKVDWNDVAGETGYEIWRLRLPTQGYNYGTGYGTTLPSYRDESWRLIKILPANSVTYTDEGLRPGGLYRYMVRALHTTGGGTFSQEPIVEGIPSADLIPPSVPQDVVVTDIRDTQLTLTWSLSTDNDVVHKYQIFDGANKFNIALGKDVIADTVYSAAPLYDQDLTNGSPAPPTSFILRNLTPLTTYNISVRSVDYYGNYSAFSDVITVTTGVPEQNGLAYKYFETSSAVNTVGTFNFNLPPKKTGTLNVNTSGANATIQQDNYSASLLSPRDRDTNIVFEHTGKIQINIIGTYTFFTTSDDGSRLFINGQEVVNNDGAHGMQERSGTYTFSAAGRYDLRVIFAQGGGGFGLHLRYQGPTGSGIAKQLIPNSVLWRPGTDPTITYYLKASAGNNLSTTSSWGTSTDGNGTSPTNFTANYQKFVIRNSSPSLNTTWSVSGIGAKVVVENGQTFTIGSAGQLNGTLEANDVSAININTPGTTPFPKFGILSPASTVNFNVPGNIELPVGSYGHVYLNASSYTTTFPVNTTIIKGNLNVATDIATLGNTNNQSVIRVGGNVTFQSANPFPANESLKYSLVFTGGTTHVVSFANPVNPNLFSIQTDFGDQVQFNNLTGNTISVGSNQGGGIILKGGSKLDLGNNNLVITGRGTINSNNETGALNMTGGNFTFSSTATQNNNIYFSLDNSLNNLTSSVPINNRSSILTAVKVNNLVTVGSGELNTGDGYLTLRSIDDGPGGTARIGPLLNGAKVSGKITVERYMSGEGRIYRYISSPVRNVTAADLQAFFPITGQFTGASVGAGLTTGNASMFQYTEPNYIQFPAVGGTNLDTLRRGKGYTPFIREASVATTWKVTGEPYQGNLPFTLTGGTGTTADGWNLLGNPYPAPIKWTGTSTGGWSMSGVNEIVYVRENTAPGVYIWRYFNGSTGTFDGIIAPGQAFWVRTTTTNPVNPSLVISESAKQIIDGAFFKEGWPDNTLEIVLKNGTAQDATHIQWRDGATEAFDTNIDGVKQDNSFFNLSSLTSDGKAMAINLTTTNYCEQEIKLRTANAPVGTYELNINGSSSIISGDEVTFTDHFTQTQKVISDTEVYTFSITDDPASKADGRFTLRLKKPEVVLNQTLKTDAACEQSSPIIKVNNSQPGVTYQAFVGGMAISEGLTSTGGTLELAVNPALVGYGSTPAIIKAGFKSCNSFELPMTIAVQRDTLPVPEILIEPLKLIASTENANYTWYFNGEELEGQTGQELLAPEDGLYVVEVARASCIKKSDTIEYAAGRITGIEKPNRLQQLYPNPTRDKVVITMEQPIDFPSIRVITTIGQSLQIQTTRISNESAEVDFTQLPTGLYLLQVNGQRYRVLKE